MNYESATLPSAMSIYDETRLRRAFRLAYFLCPDRAIAINAVFRSMVRLESVAAAQTKRLYYRQHRDAKIYRVSYSDSQLFQRLVFDSVERLAPQPRSFTDKVVRYVAFLLNQGTSRSSLYVAVATCRMLFRLSTRQTIAIYDGISDQAMMSCSEDVVRRVKQRLMEGLRNRFDGELSMQRDKHGEFFFAGNKASYETQELIRWTLEMFVPWGSACFGGQPISDVGLSGLSDTVEIQRIHALIHPSCLVKFARDAGIVEMYPWQPLFAECGSLAPEPAAVEPRSSVGFPSDEDLALIIEQYEKDREIHRTGLR